MSKPVAAASSADAGQKLAERLAGVVLLAGTIRESDLSRGIGRSLLDLPLGNGQSVLSRWCAACNHIAEAVGIDRLPVRVRISPNRCQPVVATSWPRLAVTVETDPSEYRGTGGLLCDLAQAYGPHDLLLVATGTQVLLGPTLSLATALAVRGDVAVVSTSAGESAGLLLATCGALASIRGRGYVDLKEQALPELAGRLDVRVVRAPVTSRSVRTLDGYLSAVRGTAFGEFEINRTHDPFDEDWFKTFEVCEDGSSVDAGATIHDAVVLSGARVAPDAVVVRSVICPGATVARGAVVCDQVVAGTRVHPEDPR